MGATHPGMSVEQPLWHALVGYRVLALGYVVVLCVLHYDRYAHPLGAALFVAVLAVWTLATLRRVSSAARCTVPFLVTDLALAVTGILLTAVVETPERIDAGAQTLPSIWTAGSVLAFAVRGGWRWAAGAAALVGAADVIQRGTPAADTLHNVLLLWLAAIGIGYIVEVARASERTLATALQVEAATRERERLARDIHDGVLQVLALVQRRGADIGGEAAELGRLAGEQEVALRNLISSGAAARQARAATVPAPRRGGAPAPASRDGGAAARRADPDEPLDLRTLLLPYAGARVTLVEPGAPVVLPGETATEVAAAVGAALDNVARHTGAPDGDPARAWILVEEEPDAVLVTVRDEGPGIPPGRLAEAEREGRMGVARSIRGRLRDLGGDVEVISTPGQGTEVELRVPRPREGVGDGARGGRRRGAGDD